MEATFQIWILNVFKDHDKTSPMVMTPLSWYSISEPLCLILVSQHTPETVKGDFLWKLVKVFHKINVSHVNLI